MKTIAVLGRGGQTGTYCHILLVIFCIVKQMGLIKSDHNNRLITLTMTTLSSFQCILPLCRSNIFPFWIAGHRETLHGQTHKATKFPSEGKV
jgi:fumarate reductase subunit D